MIVDFKVKCKVDITSLDKLNVLDLVTQELLATCLQELEVELSGSFQEDGSVYLTHVNDNRVIYNDYVETIDGKITDESEFQ